MEGQHRPKWESWEERSDRGGQSKEPGILIDRVFQMELCWVKINEYSVSSTLMQCRFLVCRDRETITS